jgi:hypothetical protein
MFICSTFMFFQHFVFSTLGQQWLASTPYTRRGRPETAMGGFLLPRAALLLLPHARRWEAPAAAAPLLLPCVCRRWELPAATAPHRSSSLLQLGRLSGDVGGSCSSSSNTRLGVPPPPRGELILNTHSRFQLFSRITRCIPSFLD